MNGFQKTSIIQTVKVMKNKEGLRSSQTRGDRHDNEMWGGVQGAILEEKKGIRGKTGIISVKAGV